jgi:hypothetical protein
MNVRPVLIGAALLAFATASAPVQGGETKPMLTVAEKSGYKATSRHTEVVDFCKELARRSPLVRLGELGTSHEGRPLPLVILADPPVATAREAAKSGKLIVFVMGNIHAGEVDGKEGLLMLMRDLALAKDRPLLKDLVLVFAPIFNADGNEKMAKTNRTRQGGPESVGIRANAQGLDLNRDFIKLESPEVLALVRFLNEWDPAVLIDCHTTNGSFHRYTLTYEGGRCPAGNAEVIAYVRDQLLPDAGRRLHKHTGYHAYFYGNFSPDRSEWRTVPPTPRYGTHYVGLRNRLAILSESYSYAPFRDRVLASRAFVLAVCEHAAANRDRIGKLLKAARTPPDSIVLQQTPAAVGRPHNLLGFVEENVDGRRRSTGKPKVYEVLYMGGAKPTVQVRRPYAYLVPASLTKVIKNLREHGIEIEKLSKAGTALAEVYRVEKIERARAFQKHRPVSLQVQVRTEKRPVEAGTLLVKTSQPLGGLAAYLLEPQSADGLVTWNFLDDVLAVGKDFPVVRVPAETKLDVVPVR